MGKTRTTTLERLAEEHNIEVFDHNSYPNEDGEPLEGGWYWWTCCPGCLPEGDPSGPFETYREALLDAVEPYLY